MTRREWFAAVAAAANVPDPTKFQLGRMTLPYAAFPLQRALSGIAAAGYRYVGLGTTHQEQEADRVPVIAPDAPSAKAKELAARCRDLGLEPVMMFAGIYVEAPDSIRVHTRRVEQAAAAGIRFVITWRHNCPQAAWRQHGDRPGLREDSRRGWGRGHQALLRRGQCARLRRARSHSGYPDLLAGYRGLRHQGSSHGPKESGLRPGFGEIDHYKLLAPVLRTGLTLPLVCENIFAPLVSRPSAAEDVDCLVRRAREYLELVVRGLHSA